MSLRDKLATPPAPTRRPKLMDAWMSGLPDEERAAADEMLRDHRWTHIELRKAFIEEGAPEIGVTTFRDWRNTYVAG